MKTAVIIFGPPGGGKGTQANLVANKLGLTHFDAGRFFESLIYDQKRQKDPIIRRERKLFEGGKLMTPGFVLKEVARHVKVVAGAGWGIVFSGSLRTPGEAHGLLPVIEKLYGRKNIFVFALKVPPEASIKRNSNRLICRICGAPLLTSYYPSKNPKHCPVCGGPLYRRTLDKPEVIKVRLHEYHKRTEPIFKLIKKLGYPVREIDGRPAPYKVFNKIYGYLKNVG